MDPKAEDFQAWTPYHYVHNNPIKLTDPDGQAADYYQSEDGRDLVWKEGNAKEITLNGEKFQNIGKSISVSTGDGFYINKYQNANVSKTESPVDALTSILDNGRTGEFIGKNSPLSTESKCELFQASMHKGQSEAANVMLPVIFGGPALVTGGIELGVGGFTALEAMAANTATAADGAGYASSFFKAIFGLTVSVIDNIIHDVPLPLKVVDIYKDPLDVLGKTTEIIK